MPLDWLMAKSSEGHNMQVPAGQFSHKSHIFLRTMDYSCPEENTILKTVFNFLVQCESRCKFMNNYKFVKRCNNFMIVKIVIV